MKKVLLLLIFTTLFIKAEFFNECKFDLYYANGIMMQDTEAQSQDKWEVRAKQLLSQYPQLKERLGKTDVAYNISEGMVADMWEAFQQKVALEPGYNIGWSGFKLVISQLPEVGKASEYLIQAGEIANEMAHDGTLNEQMYKYQESIKAGHGVVVVSHSQGNLFTVEAFNKLDAWMKPYFHMISVATPANQVANGGHGVTFYNDMINLVPGAMNNNISNPNKHDYIEVTRNAVGEIIDTELFTDQKSAQYHGFEYYMGYPTYEDALMDGSSTTTRREKRQTDVAKELIFGWMYDEIIAHDSRDSQWITDQEFNKNTKDYYIKVKHKYDPINIMMTQNVFPFNTDKKLYQADLGYVMASCGGKKITDSWEGKQANEFWRIDNPEEEKIKVVSKLNALHYKCNIQTVAMRDYVSYNINTLHLNLNCGNTNGVWIIDPKDLEERNTPFIDENNNCFADFFGCIGNNEKVLNTLVHEARAELYTILDNAMERKVESLKLEFNTDVEKRIISNNIKCSDFEDPPKEEGHGGINDHEICRQNIEYELSF
jgi:hypothetical protein